MLINIIVVSLVTLLWKNLSNDSSIFREEKEKKYILFIAIVLVVLAAIRGGVGDTIHYVYNYSIIGISSFRSVLNENLGVGAGYYWFSKLFSLTGLPVMFWFGFVEAFYLYSFYIFISKYSEDRLSSILYFFCLGLFMFSLAGLKQTLSMGFALLAFTSFTDKRYSLFVLFSILSFWCHTAAIAFGFGFLIYGFRKIKFFSLLTILGSILLILFGKSIWKYLIESLDDDHYIVYVYADNYYTFWTLALYVGLLLILFLKKNEYLISYGTENQFFYAMAIMVVAFQSMASSFSTAFRIAYYYLPFLIILISNTGVLDFQRNNRRMLQFIFFCIIIFWKIYTSRGYSYPFFWNGYEVLLN